jgi:hypothetical protein
MVRKPRVEFPGALSHVIALGNRGTTPFHDEVDYDKHVSPTSGTVSVSGSSPVRCVYLDGHSRAVLVESEDVSLPRTMQTLQFTYA